MTQDELKAFLEARGCEQLVEYLDPKGEPATKVLQKRLDWAKANADDADNQEEASFLIDNHKAIRKALLGELNADVATFTADKEGFDIQAFLKNQGAAEDQAASSQEPDDPFDDDDEGDAWGGTGRPGAGLHTWSSVSAENESLRTDVMPDIDLVGFGEDDDDERRRRPTCLNYNVSGPGAGRG